MADRPVTLVDLAGHLAAEPGGDLDRARRPDGVHLSKPTAAEVGAWAVDRLVTGGAVPTAARGRS